MEVVKEYIDYIKDKKKLSDNTVSSYYMDIRKYMNYLNYRNLGLKDIVENDINEAQNMVIKNEIEDAKTSIGILLAKELI